MVANRHRWIVFLFLCAPAALFSAKPEQCVPVVQATQVFNKDICISAHIYDVVQLPDGTRFLDVCSPDTPDDKCRFTVVSLWGDHDDGRRTRSVSRSGRDNSRHRRAHARPRRDGPEPFSAVLRGPPKFKPNPLLARGFNAERMPTAGERSEPAAAGRQARLHEYAGPGEGSEVAGLAVLLPILRQTPPGKEDTVEITMATSVAPRPTLKLERSEMAPKMSPSRGAQRDRLTTTPAPAHVLMTRVNRNRISPAPRSPERARPPDSE